MNINNASLGEPHQHYQFLHMTSQVKPDNTIPASQAAQTPPKVPELPPEIGGQKGPEPTRFGDWEKNGRCTDF